MGAVGSGLVNLPEGAHDGFTEAAHIIPGSTHDIDKRIAKVSEILTFHDLLLICV